jgi:2'-5' RNA ligase
MRELSFPLLRVFVALPIEGESKRQFQALQGALQPFEQSLRFANTESPHFTLTFWPQVMEIEWKPLLAQITKIAAATKPFTIKTTEPGTFGSHGEDRVLFLDIAFSEELARLKKSCPWPEGRPFAPHLTLARVSHPQRFNTQKKEVMKILKGVTCDIPFDRLRLYAEINGVKQTPIQDFPFTQEAASSPP